MNQPKSFEELYNADIMQYPSDMPEMEVSSSVEFTIQRGIFAVMSSISNLQDKDLRPYLLTKLLINTIPDKNWRLETTRKFNELCKQYAIDDMRSYEATAVCCDVVGIVTDWCIKFRSGNIRNVGLGGV